MTKNYGQKHYCQKEKRLEDIKIPKIKWKFFVLIQKKGLNYFIKQSLVNYNNHI